LFFIDIFCFVLFFLFGHANFEKRGGWSLFFFFFQSFQKRKKKSKTNEKNNERLFFSTPSFALPYVGA